MSHWDNIAWKPLGNGCQAPAGSIPSRSLSQKIANYKTQVAGCYRSLSPSDIGKLISPGQQIISPKIDGQTWFMYAKDGKVWLLSPSGRIITGIPVTDEAVKIFHDRHILMAGELYAACTTHSSQSSRPRVHDLHAALGGEDKAQTDLIRFAAFDLLEENWLDLQKQPFYKRASRLKKLLKDGRLCHSVSFEEIKSPPEILEAYHRLVTGQGQEGIVVRTGDNRIIKIKPEITIDAAIVGFTERTDGGVAEILVALLHPDGKFQLIGRVDTGFNNAQRYELSQRLRPLLTQSAYLAAARSGALFRFVRPEVVAEVKCNDLISTRANGDSIKRMLLEYTAGGWQAIRPQPAASMINAVFLQIREDKTVNPDSIRLGQITDLADIESPATGIPAKLPVSTVIRREVLTKTISGRLCIRKAVVWKTNKHETDPLYPAYVVFFTDYSPLREHPLQTDIQISSTLETINKIADAWLTEHDTQGLQARGWQHSNEDQTITLPDTCRKDNKLHLELGISFSRSSSMKFSLAVSRIKSLAKTLDPQSSPLVIEHDPKGRPLQYSLGLKQDKLIENVRKIRNLLQIILLWKGTEFTLNGQPLKINEFYSFLDKLDNIVACWMAQKRNNQPCRNTFALGCNKLKLEPSPGFPGLPQEHPAWYAVGKFEDNTIIIDKQSLIEQLVSNKNELPALCPLYEADKIRQRIEALPERLDPEKEPTRWKMGYYADSGKAAWVFPKEHTYLPYGITTQPASDKNSDTPPITINSNFKEELSITLSEPETVSRHIPPTRYRDIFGQGSAVEQVRDYAELPLKYPDIFKQVGVKPGRGILLWGPPGNGKTLLARAVAGESGAHIEIISGPELLSKWVGDTEYSLREIFQRAARLSPAVIIMDEVDALAGSRNEDDIGCLRAVVSQLLVLMDGLTHRGQVLVIATTNYPEAIDPAILRPGRIDRKIFMGQPNKQGRAALLTNLLNQMSVCDNLPIPQLADLTDNFSGAEIEHAVNEAGLLAIKEAIQHHPPTTPVKITPAHLIQSITQIQSAKSTSRPQPHPPSTSIISPYQYFAPRIV